MSSEASSSRAVASDDKSQTKSRSRRAVDSVGAKAGEVL